MITAYFSLSIANIVEPEVIIPRSRTGEIWMLIVGLSVLLLAFRIAGQYFGFE